MKRKRILSVSLAVLFTVSSFSVVSAEETTDEFAASIQANYEDPEMEYRPYARWWLAEGSHTDTTLRESIQELYDAGYGGVEFVTLDESMYLDDETYAWGSEEWVHDTKIIIEECQKLGMSVSMTSGTHWSTANLVSITPDEESASQELGYKVLNLEGDGESEEATSYRGYLPYCDLPSNVTKQTLVKVIAAKITETAEDSEDGTAKIDMDSMTDITDLAYDDNEDGIYGIDYQAEDNGDYALFIFYQYGTGESYSPAVSNSYTINYLSQEGASALIDYWETNVLTDEVQALIDQIDECDLYMDSLELSTRGTNTTGQLWCAEMLEEFAGRRSYSVDTLLPFLIINGGNNGSFGADLTYSYEADDEEDAEYIENMRRDFMQTQTELYTENCLETISSWLHTHNMKLRAENSYGQRFEISEPVTALDYVETESMEFANELDSYRGLAGAAHLLGKRYSSETGAWVSSNYVYDNEYYRQIFYLQYAAGIQKTVVHGYSSAYGPEEAVSWPGYEGMDEVWSDRFSKRQPASEDYNELNLHLSRLQKVLEQGVPQMDVAILRTDYTYNNSLTPGGLMNFVQEGVYSNKTHNQDAYYWRDMELQNNGYTYDYFSPYLLTEDSVTCTDGLINADGVAYQALILMEDELPYESAEQILEWAKNGLPVVFVNNVSELVANNNVTKDNTVAASTTGSNDGMDEALAGIVEEIKALDNVRTVDSTEDACEALQELGVYPRAQYAEENENLLTVMRSTDEADYLYVYNYMYEDEENYQGQISLDGIYQPYILDTWSGEVTLADGVSYEDDRTIVDVDIAPGETMVFVLDKDVEEGTAGTGTKTVFEETEITDWSLVVDSWEPGEKLTRTEENEETGITTTEVAYDTEHVEIDVGVLEKLISWKDMEEVGEAVSGTGTYTATFEITEEQLASAEKIVFQAENFQGGTAALWINGEKISVNMDRCSADLTDCLTVGENTISVRVTSSLRNVMIEQGYESGWIMSSPEPDDYGMTGTTTLKFYS